MAFGNLLLLGIPLALVWGGRKKKAAPQAPTAPPKTEPTVLVGGGPFIKSLPSDTGPLREAMILSGVAEGLTDPIHWKYVTSFGEAGSALEGWRLSVPVMHDALSIEGVRLTGDYNTADAVARELGVVMLTPFVSALSYAQADAKLSHTAPQPASSKTSEMIRISKLVDAKLKKAFKGPGIPLVGNASKDWVITRRFLEAGVHPKSRVPRSVAAANHGLYRDDFDPIQNVGLAHPRSHVDGTQGLRYMGPESILTDPAGLEELRETRFILMDETFAPLISGVRGKLRGKQIGEGALPFTSHPDIAPGPIA